MYCNVWTPFVVEEPTLKRELDNSTSKHTVTVTRVRYMYIHTLIDCGGCRFGKCGAHSHLSQLRNADKNAMTPPNATPTGCHQHDNFSF